MKKNEKKLSILLFILSIFFLSGKNINAQVTYIPFQDSCIWSVNVHKYMTCGDTVINGKEYLKVYSYYAAVPSEFAMKDASYYCAIRNDTTNKKVFGIYRRAIEIIDHHKAKQSTDTTEFLLYDFSLDIGDTTTVASFFFDNYIELWRVVRKESIVILGNGDQLSLSDNDSVMSLLDGSLRKRMLLEIIPEYNCFEVRGAQMWIEGIGSSNGVFTHSQTTCQIADLPFVQLLCFQQNEDILYKTELTSFDVNGDCYGPGFGGNINEITRSDLPIKIYPNPFVDAFILDISEVPELISGVGVIYNLFGQEIQRFYIYDTSTEINTIGLSKGVYFLQLTKKDQIIQTKKMIKI